MVKFILLNILFSMCFTTLGFAQEDPLFNLKLQIRPRFQASSDRGNESYSINNNLTQRTRLTFESIFSNTKTLISVQDVRTFGEEFKTIGAYGNLDVHEAYFEIGEKYKFKVGRQEIGLDELRLIGNPNFSQYNRSFDAIMYKQKFNEEIGWDIFISRINDGFANENAWKRDLAVGHFTWKRKDYNLSYLAIFEIDYIIPEKDLTLGSEFLDRLTTGLYFNRSGKLHFRFEGYYQTSIQQELDENSVHSDIKTGAYLLALNVGYKFDKYLDPILWIDFLSGDKSTTDKYEAFDTLFAANHGFYGWMDRFLNIPKHTDNKGLIDIALKNTSKLSVGQLKYAFHYFMHDIKKEFVGLELDVKYSFDILPKNISVLLGGSVFISKNEVKENEIDFWLFTMLTYHIGKSF